MPRLLLLPVALLVVAVLAWARQAPVQQQNDALPDTKPVSAQTIAAVATSSGGGNKYFDALAPSAWRAYSLRPKDGAAVTSPYYEKQFARPHEGGYQASRTNPIAVTYDATMDAAKVVIPAFIAPGTKGLGTLAAAVDATTDRLLITGAGRSVYQAAGQMVRVDEEIMEMVKGANGRPFDPATGVLSVRRGAHDTVPRAHDAGGVVTLSTNSISNTMRLPLGTEDGHTYVFTWDARWTDSYLQSGLTNHKAFNFLSKGIWLQADASYSGGAHSSKVGGFDPSKSVAAFQTRSMNGPGGPAKWDEAHANYLGPGVDRNQPLPQIATFAIAPNSWTRFWYRLEQRANDYDLVDAWIADETRPPIQILRALPVSVRSGRVDTFLIEFNTSMGRFRGNTRDLVAYVRNVLVLRDPGDTVPLLVKP